MNSDAQNAQLRGHWAVNVEIASTWPMTNLLARVSYTNSKSMPVALRCGSDRSSIW
jgi:hypothetical protein